VIWFVSQSIAFLLFAFALGVLVGWLLWARSDTPAPRTVPFGVPNATAVPRGTNGTPTAVAVAPAALPPVVGSRPASARMLPPTAAELAVIRSIDPQLVLRSSPRDDESGDDDAADDLDDGRFEYAGDGDVVVESVVELDLRDDDTRVLVLPDTWAAATAAASATDTMTLPASPVAVSPTPSVGPVGHGVGDGPGGEDASGEDAPAGDDDPGSQAAPGDEAPLPDDDLVGDDDRDGDDTGAVDGVVAGDDTSRRDEAPTAAGLPADDDRPDDDDQPGADEHPDADVHPDADDHPDAEDHPRPDDTVAVAGTVVGDGAAGGSEAPRPDDTVVRTDTVPAPDDTVVLTYDTVVLPAVVEPTAVDLPPVRLPVVRVPPVDVPPVPLPLVRLPVEPPVGQAAHGAGVDHDPPGSAVENAPGIRGVMEPGEPERPGGEESDDLRRIEGIGPKISAVLAAAGFRTYRQLAEADDGTITAALAAGKLRIAPGRSTWPEQARFLADGDDEGFAKLKAELKAQLAASRSKR
jgi:hypothetical protein